MQERLADFYYLAERITKNLRGLNQSLIEIKNNTILVAHDLSPIDALKYCKIMTDISEINDVKILSLLKDGENIIK